MSIFRWCILTRKFVVHFNPQNDKREQAVVMIALEDYESLQETAYLLRNPANAKRLLQSIEAAEKGIAIEREINPNE